MQAGGLNLSVEDFFFFFAECWWRLGETVRIYIYLVIGNLGR